MAVLERDPSRFADSGAEPHAARLRGRAWGRRDPAPGGRKYRNMDHLPLADSALEHGGGTPETTDQNPLA